MLDYKKKPRTAAWRKERGRKGGLVGGPARARALTAEQRSEQARKASLARWAKYKRENA